MSESQQHTHPIRYTVYTVPYLWWKRVFGLVDKRVYVGVKSGQHDKELFIATENGGVVSLNYDRVLWMESEPLPERHATQKAAHTFDQELRQRVINSIHEEAVSA